ncbi:hypothetical protein AB0H76_11150 [Nocardia sp. NPDC050712]
MCAIDRSEPGIELLTAAGVSVRSVLTKELLDAVRRQDVSR